MGDAPLWVPSPERAAASAMGRFREAKGFDTYPDLHRWSVEHLEAFWSSMWDWAGVVGDRGERVIEVGETMPDTRFFPDARLNVAEVILHGGGAAPDDLMFVSVDERAPAAARNLRRDETRARVVAMAVALRAAGVRPGDRVAAWLPNIAEAMITMLATAAIGGVYSSTSPDFGVDGVLDRFGQIEPVALVAADGYSYGGKTLDCLERLATIRSSLPTVRAVVLVGHRDGLGAEPSGDWSGIADVVTWDDFLATASADEVAAFRFERFAFDQPWYVLFSSGTTGVPKCIVHRAGGVLLQHLKEHQLHCDIGAGDRVAYYTTCGWMMWNWLASVPASGATAVLYDGSPFHPGPSALTDLAEALQLTLLGVSAKYLDSVRKAGFVPRDHAPLASLRTVCSTGSPLSPETNTWAVESLPDGVHVASISGGTDLCSCFVAGDPTSPAWPGEIQRPGLAMAVDIYDEQGRPAGVDERGELVCTAPFPSMPLGFWADDDGSRYRAAYFEKNPGIWSHGDFASWTVHGGMIVHGRSDTTLNPGGVRIGTAEIYRRVDQIDEIVESMVFGQDWDGDSRIVLLVRLAPGVSLDDELVASIKHTIRVGCTPRHVPAVVLAVDDLPRTRSGKLAELAVTDAVNGREVRNTSALANPEAIDAIATRPELRP
ncbi:MAG: acetoacetate--CoA ligase [Acidimicrobiales bacterium]